MKHSLRLQMQSCKYVFVYGEMYKKQLQHSKPIFCQPWQTWYDFRRPLTTYESECHHFKGLSGSTSEQDHGLQPKRMDTTPQTQETWINFYSWFLQKWRDTLLIVCLLPCTFPCCLRPPKQGPSQLTSGTPCSGSNTKAFDNVALLVEQDLHNLRMGFEIWTFI